MLVYSFDPRFGTDGYVGLFSKARAEREHRRKLSQQCGFGDHGFDDIRVNVISVTDVTIDNADEVLLACEIAIKNGWEDEWQLSDYIDMATAAKF